MGKTGDALGRIVEGSGSEEIVLVGIKQLKIWGIPSVCALHFVPSTVPFRSIQSKSGNFAFSKNLKKSDKS